MNTKTNTAFSEAHTKQIAIDIYDEMIRVRRHLHQYPELYEFRRFLFL